tara:strand:- start:1393 stop:1737 length:345 start_codon:yes stop_codon:yes gene_type:complete
MAYSDYNTPSEFFGSGYSSDGTSITFTIGTGGTLPNLTSADADALTGDFRSVVYELNSGTFGKYDEIVREDKPTQMSLSRSRSESSGVLKSKFNYSFNMGGDKLSVLPEPPLVP